VTELLSIDPLEGNAVPIESGSLTLSCLLKGYSELLDNQRSCVYEFLSTTTIDRGRSGYSSLVGLGMGSPKPPQPQCGPENQQPRTYAEDESPTRGRHAG